METFYSSPNSPFQSKKKAPFVGTNIFPDLRTPYGSYLNPKKAFLRPDPSLASVPPMVSVHFWKILLKYWKTTVSHRIGFFGNVDITDTWSKGQNIGFIWSCQVCFQVFGAVAENTKKYIYLVSLVPYLDIMLHYVCGCLIGFDNLNKKCLVGSQRKDLINYKYAMKVVGWAVWPRPLQLHCQSGRTCRICRPARSGDAGGKLVAASPHSTQHRRFQLSLERNFRKAFLELY